MGYLYWYFKLLIENLLPNIFLGKKEELEALQGELNGSRQQLQLVEQVSSGEPCTDFHTVTDGSHFSQLRVRPVCHRAQNEPLVNKGSFRALFC